MGHRKVRYSIADDLAFVRCAVTLTFKMWQTGLPTFRRAKLCQRHSDPWNGVRFRYVLHSIQIPLPISP